MMVGVLLLDAGGDGRCAAPRRRGVMVGVLLLDAGG